MRFLANENFPGDAVSALEFSGHDELDSHRGARKDFGELAWRAGLPASSGIILFRLPMPAAADVGVYLAARIGERTDWAGHFTVLEPGRIRMRPLSAQ